MAIPTRGILQLDFDGTLAQGDVSVGILSHFLGPVWQERVEAAGRELLATPDSTALVDTMVAGYADLQRDKGAYLRFAREHHPMRTGLRALVDAAKRIGLECHVVSNGFEFYIRDYLRAEAVEDRVALHTGTEDRDGSLVYIGPGGLPTRRRFKQAWSEHFLARHDLLVYAGDGSSDVAPASKASIVFARDSLLTHASEGFEAIVYPFEALQDIVDGLPEVLDRGA